METFRPDALMELFGALGLFRLMPMTAKDDFGQAVPLNIKIPAATLEEVKAELRAAERECRLHGLPVSAMAVARAFDLLSKPAVDWDDMRKLAEELHGRLRDEISTITFLSLNALEAALYNSPAAGWGDVINRFPSTALDVQEAGKSLALNRSTACVYHSMRVIEVGLRALGKSLNDPRLNPQANPSWGSILVKCDAELQKERRARSPEWAADELFFSTATANLRAVQYAWRNPTLHIERNYDGEEAREVWAASRAFMRHLAKKLSE